MNRLVLVGALLFGLAGCRSEAQPPIDGERVFLSACAKCHGRDGRGGLAAPGHAPPRDLRASAWQDAVDDKHITRVITGGAGTMPAFDGVLKPAEVQAVVAHVRSLRGQSVTANQESAR